MASANELKEAREQQAATAEILKIIACSPGNVQPVFETIAASAKRLMGGHSAAVFRFVDGVQHLVALTPTDPAADEMLKNTFPMPLANFTTSQGSKVLNGETDQIEDTETGGRFQVKIARARGFRSSLFTPLMLRGTPIGMINVTRREPGRFADHHVELLRTFADQAVIAVENTRMFEEVQARTRDLQESLQQQTATADVLKVISRSAFDLDTVMDTLARSARHLCGAEGGALFLRDGDMLVCRGVEAVSAENEKFMKANPVPLNDESHMGRAVLTGTIVNIGEIEQRLKLRKFQQALGFKSFLAVPLMREGQGVGVLTLTRFQIGEFTERQVELVQTFADQAVIAIENVRLFNDVQAKTREVTEALTYQTGSANILRVIASSPTDVQPVLRAIVESACILCEAYDAVVLLKDGDDLRASAHHGPIPLSFTTRPLNRRWVAGRSVIDKATLHVHDLLGPEGNDFPDTQKILPREGHRTVLCVPLLREDEAIGSIALRRMEVQPFTEKQIGLLQAFADQSVIALGNVRLFEEVQAKTRDLAESLQQQTATADVLKVISRSTFNLQLVLDTLVETAARLCETKFAFIIRRDGDLSRVVATSQGISTRFVQWLRENPVAMTRASAGARAIMDKKIVHIHDVLAYPDYQAAEHQSRGGYRTVLHIPLLRGDEAIGAFSLAHTVVKPFTEKQIELVTTFADQAVIAIENVRLFNETREALERQTATADILKVIASSPADVQPVFEAVAASANRLIGGLSTAVLRFVDGNVHLASFTPISPEADAVLKSSFPGPIAAFQPFEAASEGKLVQIEDAEAGEDPPARQVARARGYRSLLLAPLMNAGLAIGLIGVTRTAPGPFSPHHVQLLQTFADQAVIAVENVRLFNETKEALERQTATADILKVIASSPDDVHPVFQAIAERSNKLMNGLSTTVYRLVDDIAHLMAFTPVSPDADAVLRAAFPAPISQFRWNEAIFKGDAYEVSDAEAEFATKPAMLELSRLRGWRSSLAVPLMRDGQPIGLITVTRIEPGCFDYRLVQLLKTFADQAVIAISNVELFNEVQARTRELSASLDDLRAAQDRLVQTEKLASLGQLTAGIAHEIKNPLNFVNNFSALSVELTDELNDMLKQAELAEKMRLEVGELTQLLKSNLEKVVQHGKRADSIVKNMLLHSREGRGERRIVDINALVEESLNLAYHGARAERSDFQITLERDLDPGAGQIELYPQEITRALLNMISNGFYAATRRASAAGDGFEPTLLAATRGHADRVEIRIRDNGTGIPPEVKDKMFNPFFTTKPAGEGTGLGLSMSHDIVVKQHGGTIDVETEPGAFTEFIVTLPRATSGKY